MKYEEVMDVQTPCLRQFSAMDLGDVFYDPGAVGAPGQLAPMMVKLSPRTALNLKTLRRVIFSAHGERPRPLRSQEDHGGRLTDEMVPVQITSMSIKWLPKS